MLHYNHKWHPQQNPPLHGSISVCSVQVREEGKISWCPFFSKFGLLWVWFWGTHLLSILSIPGTTITFLSVSHFVYWGLGLAFFLLGYTSHCLHVQAAQPSGLGPEEYDQTEMWVALYLWLVSYWLLPALRGLVQVFLSFGYLCKWAWTMGELYLFTIFGEASCVHS